MTTGAANATDREAVAAAAARALPPLSGLVGIEYLLAEQRADGTWPHANWLQANVAPDTFYILAEAARHYPPRRSGAI